MIARRDLIIGAGCVVAAGASNLLKPHRSVPLLKKGTLADVVPAEFGSWRSQEVGDPLAINAPGTLSAKLYNELVTRVYSDVASGSQVMVLLAYGAQQTAELSLHRPEICYPSFGYALSQNEPTGIYIGKDVSVPARQMIATTESRIESVIYWSRVGEYLPTSSAEQRKARLEISLQGIIPDGVLSRFSTVTDRPAEAFAMMKRFIPELVKAIPAAQRAVLIGTARAQRLVQA